MSRSVEFLDERGETQTRVEQVAPERDTYGNADGSQFDLAVDGTAGTGRYVMNAAAWLTNHERFGDKVVGMKN